MNQQLREKIISCGLCDPLGIYYHREREENLNFAYDYLPDKVIVLWIVESPPYSYPPRYFYRMELTRFDSLFRETMKAVSIEVSDPKDRALDEFKSRGHFLIDSIKCPADKNYSHLKSKMRNNCKEILKEEIIQLDPEKILIIKADVYYPVISLLNEIDKKYPVKKILNRVLNKNPIPYPGTGHQVRFREMVQNSLKIVNNF